MDRALLSTGILLDAEILEQQTFTYQPDHEEILVTIRVDKARGLECKSRSADASRISRWSLNVALVGRRLCCDRGNRRSAVRTRSAAASQGASPGIRPRHLYTRDGTLADATVIVTENPRREGDPDHGGAGFRRGSRTRVESPACDAVRPCQELMALTARGSHRPTPT